MPRMDGTGPWGLDPIGQGFFHKRQYFRCGFRRGMGFGCGVRQGGFYGLSKEERKELLKEKKAWLKEQIEAIDKQLEEL